MEILSGKNINCTEPNYSYVNTNQTIVAQCTGGNFYESTGEIIYPADYFGGMGYWYPRVYTYAGNTIVYADMQAADFDNGLFSILGATVNM